AYEKEVNAEGDVSGKKDFRYPLVLPIVFYDGEGEWTAETNFLQKTEPNDPLYAKYIPTFEYMVVNLNKLSREALLRFGDPLSFMMLIDKIRRPEDMSLLSNIPAGYVRSFSDSLNEGIKKLLVDVITSLLVRADIPREEIDAVTDDIQERRYSEMFNWLEGYSVQETRRQVREEERRVWEEERRVWEEKLRQAESQRQQADREKAMLQERIRHLEQAVKG
ncbi:MAG: Rpn family recombination-promoting nuclease/putative transposase, partial [Treponema sp.]|nr:Rpn family recombination-promoting nuclease/putative transposase [Treponema sp.]